MDEQIAAIYADCHHTKYEGCRPCPHDLAVQRYALEQLTREAQEMGLYEATELP